MVLMMAVAVKATAWKRLVTRFSVMVSMMAPAATMRVAPMSLSR